MRISRRLIAIAGLRDIVERRIPVLSIDSRISGPTVWLTACIHGDEPGGTAIVHDVFAALRASGIRRGRIHALPLVNSMGFESVSRYINADREDLNRCFPGAADGTMGEQIAHRLFTAILETGPSLVIDLHNDWIQSVPYCLFESAGCYHNEWLRGKVHGAGLATGLLTVEDEPAVDAPSGTLSASFVAEGIPALTIETGGAGAVLEPAVNAGKAGILSVLSYLEMIDAASTADESAGNATPLRYSNRPRCRSSGMIRFAVAPGDRVERGQQLASVFSAFGSREETLRAEASGFVLGIADHARAVAGSEVIAMAEISNGEDD